MAEETAQQEPEKKKRLSFRQSLRIIFNDVSRKDLKGIFWHTLKDLRKPREIGILLASSFVPGGWIGWFAYRVAKYQFNKAAANDNAEGAHSLLKAGETPLPQKYSVMPLVAEPKETEAAQKPAAALAPKP